MDTKEILDNLDDLIKMTEKEVKLLKQYKKGLEQLMSLDIYQLIDRLKNTTSKKEKEAILKLASDDRIKRYLKLAFDPNILSYLKKPIQLDKSGNKNFYDTIDEFEELYYKLNNREITGNNAINTIKEFLETCNTKTQELYQLALQKKLRIGISTKILNKVYGNDFIEIFEVQLANKFDENKHDIKGWYINQKLDGLRAYFQNGKLYTRQGKLIIGFDHIVKELNLLANKFNLEVIDGELYSKDLDFNTIQGYVMRNKNINEEHKKQIKFHCFAVVSNNIKNTSQMINILNKFKSLNLEYVIPLDYYKIESLNELKQYHELFLSQGYEGTMLRHPVNYYTYGRSNDLLKYKTFKEDDFECIKINIGKISIQKDGKEKEIETVTSIVVQKDNVVSEVGSGFSIEMRNEIYNNQDYYIGKLAEIKYFEITKDNSLRFPVFLKWKLDR